MTPPPSHNVTVCDGFTICIHACWKSSYMRYEHSSLELRERPRTCRMAGCWNVKPTREPGFFPLVIMHMGPHQEKPKSPEPPAKLSSTVKPLELPTQHVSTPEDHRDACPINQSKQFQSPLIRDSKTVLRPSGEQYKLFDSSLYTILHLVAETLW